MAGKQGLTFQELCAGLASAYGEIPAGKISSIVGFLDHLARHGVLEFSTFLPGKMPPLPVCSLARDGYAPLNPIHPSIDCRSPLVLSAPIFVWWDVTSKCNLRCKQCYSSSGQALPDELTTDEAKRLISELAEMKVFFIYFLGGEPLLRPDLFELLAHCQRQRVRVMMSTNGWFVTAEVAHRFANLGVSHVRVSIDGATAATHDEIRGRAGSFDRAIAAVKHLVAAGIPVVGMSPTMMGDNFHEAEAILNLAVSLRVSEIQFGQVCKVGRATGVRELSAAQTGSLSALISRSTSSLKDRLHVSAPEGTWQEKPFLDSVCREKIIPHIMGCGAGRAAAAIGPSGQVRACLMYNFPIGSVRDAPFRRIWSAQHTSDARGHANLQWLRSLKKGCTGCSYSAVCSGPCPMQRAICPPFERKRFVRNRIALHKKRKMICPLDYQLPKNSSRRNLARLSRLTALNVCSLI